MEATPSSSLEIQVEADRKDLRLLSILHTVYGCLNLVAIIVLWIANGFMLKAMHLIGGLAAEPMEPSKGPAAPSKALEREAEDLLSGRVGPNLFEPQLALIIGFSICLGCLLYFWSASCLKQRKKVWVTYAASVLAIFNVPIGLALGIFTIVVLRRPSVAAQFR